MKLSDLRKLTSQTTVPNKADILVKMEGEEGTTLKLLEGEYRTGAGGTPIMILTVGKEDQ